MSHLIGCQKCGCKVVYKKETDIFVCINELCGFFVTMDQIKEMSDLKGKSLDHYIYYLKTGEI